MFLGARVRVSQGGERAGYENTDHSLPRVKGLGSVRVIYFIEKTNGVSSKRPTLKNTNSPILSMLAINRNRVFCASHSRM